MDVEFTVCGSHIHCTVSLLVVSLYSINKHGTFLAEFLKGLANSGCANVLRSHSYGILNLAFQVLLPEIGTCWLPFSTLS